MFRCDVDGENAFQGQKRGAVYLRQRNYSNILIPTNLYLSFSRYESKKKRWFTTNHLFGCALRDSNPRPTD